MDTVFSAPAATAFDAVAALVSASVYVLVGLAALAQAPRDVRVRVFLAIAVASFTPYAVTALIWARGSERTFSRGMVVALALSLMMGSLALFHFTQVFPWRRPWIRAHGGWLWGAYAAVLLLTGTAAALTPEFDMQASGGLGAVSPSFTVLVAIVILGVALPVLFVVGLAAPFAGLMSLYKSWIAAKRTGIQSARATTLWMLISQMGGGVLTILIIPLLRLLAPTGPWVTIAAALLFACGLLMPLAFALGIWQFDVLALDIDALPQ